MFCKHKHEDPDKITRDDFCALKTKGCSNKRKLIAEKALRKIKGTIRSLRFDTETIMFLFSRITEKEKSNILRRLLETENTYWNFER